MGDGWCVCGGGKKRNAKNKNKKGFYYAHWHLIARETWHVFGQILLSAERKRLRPQLLHAVFFLEQYAAGDLVADNGQIG